MYNHAIQKSRQVNLEQASPVLNQAQPPRMIVGQYHML